MTRRPRQINFFVRRRQIPADLFDDAFLDQDFVGFIVLPVDARVGKFFHDFLLYGFSMSW
jgi:hypothetical protein